MGKLWALENKGKGKRKLNPACWGAQKGTRLGCLGTPRSLELSRYAERNQLGLGQLKGAYSWTQRTKVDMSHQTLMVQKKADGLGINTSKKEAWYLEECRKVDYEGR